MLFRSVLPLKQNVHRAHEMQGPQREQAVQDAQKKLKAAPNYQKLQQLKTALSTANTALYNQANAIKQVTEQIVTDDGNCLFGALAIGLPDLNGDAKALRAQFLAAVTREKTIDVDFMEGRNRTAKLQALKQFINTNGAWNDDKGDVVAQMAMRYVSNRYNKIIYIVNKNRLKGQIRVMIPSSYNQAMPTVFALKRTESLRSALKHHITIYNLGKKTAIQALKDTSLKGLIYTGIHYNGCRLQVPF
mgnify:CR=1 FL=1